MVLFLNKDGADLFTSTFHRHYDVPQIKPVSTIGAGDTFSAGILYGLHNAKATKENLQSLTESQWDNALNYAITFATEVCMSYENYITLH